MPDQRALSPHRFVDVLLLTLVAGSADALGYLNLGKVFTSNMTGNVVLMGISVSEGRGSDTGRSLFALLAFIVGNSLGAWLCFQLEKRRSPRGAVTAALGCEAVLLLIYALFSCFLPPDRQLANCYPFIALLAASMGLQAAAVYRLGTPGITTTAITGTLTTLFAGLMKTFGAGATLQPRDRGTDSLFGLQAIAIVLYCGGAAASGAFDLYAKPWAGFFPAITVMVVVLIRLTRRT
jgi:uncharacterized membrane protein YoaK (UPF0700 family)